jgi:hypothetical protein
MASEKESGMTYVETESSHSCFGGNELEGEVIHPGEEWRFGPEGDLQRQKSREDWETGSG